VLTNSTFVQKRRCPRLSAEFSSRGELFGLQSRGSIQGHCGFGHTGLIRITESASYTPSPLASLYLWRGAKTLKEWSIGRREAMGAWFLLLGSLLAISSAGVCAEDRNLSRRCRIRKGDRLQPIAALVLWTIVGADGLVEEGSFRHRLTWVVASNWWIRNSGLRFVAVAAVTILVGLGLLH